MQTTTDLEAKALAACYSLLIKKAQERRARLARGAIEKTMAEAGDEVETDETKKQNAPK